MVRSLILPGVKSWLRRLFGRLSEELFYIGGSDTLPPPLSQEQEQKMLTAFMAGSDEARAVLIEHNLRLVVYISKKFENSGVNLEDLISIGSIGLIKAINTFKPDKKIKLATYASRCIENEILMYLRKNTPNKTNISIDEPLNVDWDGNELLLSDILGTDNDITQRRIEDRVDKELLIIAMEKLSPREQKIMRLRFGINSSNEEKTQKQVADMLGISQSYISRLEKRIMSRLKRDINKMING